MALEKVLIQYKSNEKWPKIASGKWNLRVQGSKLKKKHYWRNIVTRCKFLIASLYVNDMIHHIWMFENIADRSWYKSEGKLALFMSYDFYDERKAR